MPTGNPGKKRKPHNNETKRKIGFANLGNKHSFEVRKKISLAHKGKKFTEEHKRKMSESQKGRIAWNKGKKMSEKTCKKMSDSRKGNKNHGWIVDRTELKKDRLKMYDCAYKDWMKKVKIRDNWKCKIFNFNCKGRLEAHHILNWIDYPELRYEINNGITLCQAHHPRKRAEEKRLSPYFQELVSVSKK